MSTKIYTGFRLVDQKKLEASTLASFITHLHAKLMKSAQAACAKYFTERLMNHYDDRVTLSGEATPVADICAEVITEWRKEFGAKEVAKKADTKHHASVRLYETPSAGVIGYAWMAEPSIAKEIYKLSGVADFSYWNNTDRDDAVPKREWDLRAKAWDEAWRVEDLKAEPSIELTAPEMEKTGTLKASLVSALKTGRKSLKVVVIHTTDIAPQFSPADLETNEHRATRAAIALLASKRLKADNLPWQQAMSQFMHHHREILKGLEQNDPETQEAITQLREECLGRLNRRWATDMEQMKAICAKEFPPLDEPVDLISVPTHS